MQIYIKKDFSFEIIDLTIYIVVEIPKLNNPKSQNWPVVKHIVFLIVPCLKCNCFLCSPTSLCPLKLSMSPYICSYKRNTFIFSSVSLWISLNLPMSPYHYYFKTSLHVSPSISPCLLIYIFLSRTIYYYFKISLPISLNPTTS